MDKKTLLGRVIRAYFRGPPGQAAAGEILRSVLGRRSDGRPGNMNGPLAR
jgi:hypothetical protein